MEFELAYQDVAVQHISHYTMETVPCYHFDGVGILDDKIKESSNKPPRGPGSWPMIPK